MHSPLVHNYGGQVQQQPSTSQDRQHFMSNQHQSIYMPSPQQQSHIQQHGNVLQGVLTSSVSNYVNPNPMQSGPRPTMLSPSNQGVIMGMPVARLPMNQAMSSIPPQNIIISNPHQNLTPPVNDIEPQKTKRKRVTKKQQQKEMEKEQQLRFQHEQQQMMATTHMPQQADFYMQQQRIQSQQVMHPMPGQSIHARMQVCLVVWMKCIYL
jgi:hypothetical protein